MAREAVFFRDLRAAVLRHNPGLPEFVREQAVEKLTRVDFARSLVQHNREFYGFIRKRITSRFTSKKARKRGIRSAIARPPNAEDADREPTGCSQGYQWMLFGRSIQCGERDSTSHPFRVMRTTSSMRMPRRPAR